MLLWRKARQVLDRDQVVGVARLRRLVTLAADSLIEHGPALDSFWLRTDAEGWSISRFIKASAEQLPEGSLVLDAGAGSSPYAGYFRRHRYHSCEAVANRALTFVTDLHHIPVQAASYDAVVCTQVLEHVQYPQKVLDEIFRALRPGGMLYLTAPQGWGLHQEPHHYFNFTRYGLDLLFRNAGFQEVTIGERGGIMWYIGKRFRSLVPYLYWQHRGAGRFILFLIFLLSAPLLRSLLPLSLFYLDAVDVKKGYTLGYACVGKKPVG
jgi:SAM-dependent methyltransferase